MTRGVSTDATSDAVHVVTGDAADVVTDGVTDAATRRASDGLGHAATHDLMLLDIHLMLCSDACY